MSEVKKSPDKGSSNRPRPGVLGYLVPTLSVVDTPMWTQELRSWENLRMDAAQLWPELRSQRLQLADQIEALDETAWDVASWCDGWRVRDALGHLVHLAEATQLSMGADVIRGGLRPDRALSRSARCLGDLPVPELCRRLRASADGRFHVFGSPAAVALGEVLVHGSDALRPVGAEVHAPPTDATAVLDAYWKLGRLAFHAAPHQGHRLTATDCDWTKGSGSEIKGKAIDLLLFVANRSQVLPNLEGVSLRPL